VVGDAAGGAGQVWVRGGEEVERYLRGKDLGREGGGEEGWKAGLEDAESCRERLASVVPPQRKRAPMDVRRRTHGVRRTLPQL
jgi:hypothetical protein